MTILYGSQWGQPYGNHKGYSVSLYAWPVNGRLVLRETDAEDMQTSEPKSKTTRSGKKRAA